MNEITEFVLSMEKDNPQWRSPSISYEWIKRCNEDIIDTINHQTIRPETVSINCECTDTHNLQVEEVANVARIDLKSVNHCPFYLKSHMDYGRHYVAARKIKAGEVIILERPAILAPLVSLAKDKGKTHCLFCLKGANNFLCPLCGFYLCGEKCLSSHDKNECAVLQRLSLVNHQRHIHRIKSKPFLERLKIMSEEEQKSANKMMENATLSFLKSERQRILKYYPILAVLRTLLLMLNNQKMKDVISSLQGLLNESSLQYKINKNVIVNPIIENLELDYSADFIQKIAAVWDTNAFEVALGTGETCQGLYPASSFMTHSCFPNCDQSFSSDEIMVLRAVDDILPDDILTISYTDVLWPTYIRREHLRKTKGFTCTCVRCLDPTEFHTFIGSILCQTCDDFFLPSAEEEGSPSKVWCRKCATFIQTKDVLKCETEAAKTLKQNTLKTFVEIKEAKASLDSKFHSNHHLVFRMSVIVIGKISNMDIKEMETNEILGMSAWMKSVYSTCCKLLPRLNRLRATVGKALIRLEREKINRVGLTTNDTEEWKLFVDDINTVLSWHNDSLPSEVGNPT